MRETCGAMRGPIEAIWQLPVPRISKWSRGTGSRVPGAYLEVATSHGCKATGVFATLRLGFRRHHPYGGHVSVNECYGPLAPAETVAR
jgi:hypothetical protein